MRTEARFPGKPLDAGHYESFYLKAARPSGGRAVWIRHTVHKRPGAEPTASIWLTLFDAETTAPRATKATFGADQLSAPAGAYVAIDGARLEPGLAEGAVPGPPVEASWELRFTDDAGPFHHLPYDRLYEGTLPRTKLLSPHPAATFTGRLALGDDEISLDGWPGMVGHNWGAEHAERWVWIQGSQLAGRPRFCLDLAGGRIKVGGITTPWVANGLLRIDGEEHRLGGLGRAISTRIDEHPTTCVFRVAGRHVRVRGRVHGEPRRFVAWRYADPDGLEHNTLNCSIADLELEVEGSGRDATRLALRGGAAYEIGMRETDHGVPLQPFPDG